MLRCPGCQIDMSDGAQYDAVRVMQAIDQYIHDWFAGNVADDVITHQKLVEKEAKERAATYTVSRGWKHG